MASHGPCTANIRDSATSVERAGLAVAAVSGSATTSWTPAPGDRRTVYRRCLVLRRLRLVRAPVLEFVGLRGVTAMAIKTREVASRRWNEKITKSEDVGLILFFCHRPYTPTIDLPVYGFGPLFFAHHYAAIPRAHRPGGAVCRSYRHWHGLLATNGDGSYGTWTRGRIDAANDAAVRPDGTP